ncbi:MAG: gliding motility-associated C-terminal domain-containing protein, partial [bacterium]|nr:gliding motility-associated C-terminal domain-containing protein [bacterium]
MSKNPSAYPLLVLCGVLALFGHQASASERWTIGTEERPWGEEAGHLVSLDHTTDMGWLQPIFVENQNLSLGAIDRGGWITSDLHRGTNLLPGIINGNHNVAFPDLSNRVVQARENQLDRDVTLILDIGAAFGVDSISFYPRTGVERTFMRGYQVWVHDGFGIDELAPPTNSIEGLYSFVKEWNLVGEQFPTREPFARLKIPLQFVRFVAISDTISLPDPTLWEIDELEVWGNGYSATGQFESKVIDLGDRANFGRIIWSATSDSGSSIQIRTRTGQTPDTFIYHRLTGLGLTGERQVSKAEYDKLRPTEKGSIEDDTQNWTPWSAPYPNTGTEPLINSGPARYFQFSIDFRSTFPLARTKIDSLAIEFSTPLFGREFLAEFAPQVVVPGEPTLFTYAVRAALDEGDTGFDALDISTPLAADVKNVSIDNADIAFDLEVRDDGFIVRFPDTPITKHGTLLKVTFEATVLVYGTRFVGKVFNTNRESDLPQLVKAGDATRDISTNDLLVTWHLDQSLLASVDVSRPIMTPNGDGINDAVDISYSLLQVIKPIEVAVEIYDLSGRRIWQHVQEQSNGQYVVSWQGIGDSGQVVSPGLYVYRIVANASTGIQHRTGTLGIA